MSSADEPRARPFAGAVLAGGRSARMGVDKAWLTAGGEPLAARGLRALSAAGAAELVAVGGDGERFRALGLRWVPDRWPGEGPLGGLITALRAVTSPVVAVLACDLPAPDAEVIATLVSRMPSAGGVGADGVVPEVGGRRQYLHAVYHRRLLAPLEAAFDAGQRSLRSALAASNLAWPAMDDPKTAASVADLDTPEALAAYCQGKQVSSRP